MKSERSRTSETQLYPIYLFSYNRTKLYLGIAFFLCGSALITLEAVEIAKWSIGIWCGVFLLVFGLVLLLEVFTGSHNIMYLLRLTYTFVMLALLLISFTLNAILLGQPIGVIPPQLSTYQIASKAIQLILNFITMVCIMISVLYIVTEWKKRKLQINPQQQQQPALSTTPGPSQPYTSNPPPHQEQPPPRQSTPPPAPTQEIAQ